MAAADLANGRPVLAPLVSKEITMFLLAKEFHWTPKQIKEQDAKDIKALTKILSIYNKIQNRKMERINKGK